MDAPQKGWARVGQKVILSCCGKNVGGEDEYAGQNSCDAQKRNGREKKCR